MATRPLGRCAPTALLALALSAVLVVRPARACGGLFCSATPVDQTAERIIFTVNGDSTISAYVQISYTGQRDAFAWVVPVPSVPSVATFRRAAFQALDLATQPLIFPPLGCSAPVLINGGGGVRSQSDVTVYRQEAVGPYQTAVIGGTNTASLVDWLRTNGYVITDAMVPFIEPYVQQRMMFLAMRLLPDKDVSDIEPVMMTYTGQEPMVPLQLTAVAARPQMGVVVWILADQRFASTNYAELTIDDDELSFTVGSNNYATLVSQKAHAVGGHGFVTELAAPIAGTLELVQNSSLPISLPDAMMARDELVALLQRFRYITRLYTRMSPEDMTVDPTFAPALNQTDVSNVHDFRARQNDAGTCQAPACAFTDCGSHGRCVEILSSGPDAGITTTFPDRVEACACDDGYTAVPLQTTFALGSGVQCAPVTNNLMPSDGTAGACRNIDCGAGGQCIAINGSPTCACAPGSAANAVAVFNGTTFVPVVRCIDVNGPIPPTPAPTPQPSSNDAGAPAPTPSGSPDAGAERASGGGDRGGSACGFAGSASGSWRAAALAWAGLFVALRRRRALGSSVVDRFVGRGPEV